MRVDTLFYNFFTRLPPNRSCDGCGVTNDLTDFIIFNVYYFCLHFSLSDPLSLYLSLSPSLSFSLSPSLSLTIFISPSLSLTIFLSPSLSPSPSLTHSLSVCLRLTGDDDDNHVTIEN